MENVFFSFDLSILLLALAAVIAYLFFRKRRAEGYGPRTREKPGLRGPETFKLSIRLGRDGRWQLLDEEGELVGPLHVIPGDTIIWRTNSSDAFFQFPRLELFEGLQQSWTAQIGQQDELRLTISERACDDIYIYAVFCNVNERTKPEVGYAEGGSPPTIIIKRH